MLSALEWLANAKLFGTRGLLAWPILRLRVGMTARIGVNSVFGSRTLFTSVQFIRFLAGGVLLLSSTAAISVFALIALVVSTAYTNFRACFGGDGSDQMGFIVSIGALLMGAGIAADDWGVGNAGIILVAGQAFLAYFVAGASKVISPIWRSGAAVSGVMQTTTFGNPWAARITSSIPNISYLVGWFVIVTEMLFPLTFVAPPWLLTASLIGFAAFHLSNAYFMGLNSFIFSFLATYPAIEKINFDIRSLF